MLSIDIYSTQAVIRSQEPLTVGLVGGMAHFRFSDQWKSLVKTAVFRQGNVTRDIMGISNQAVIPWEVLQQPGLPVYIGIYGSDSKGNVVIPTVWAVTDPVSEGADPARDVTLPPTPEVTQQLQNQIGSLDQLATSNKDNLVMAINEASRSLYMVRTNTDGTVDKTIAQMDAACDAGKCLVLYDGGYLCTLEHSSKDENGKSVYTFRCHENNQYQKVRKVTYPNLLTCSTDNLRAVWRVSVEKKEGVYQANRSTRELAAAYQEGKNLICYLDGRELCLIGTAKREGTFRFHFHGRSADGNLMQQVTLYAPNGDADAKALGTVRTEPVSVDLSGYGMLGKVGIIGDSLSVGVEDLAPGQTQQYTDHAWGAWLSRMTDTPCAFLGFSGATSATFITHNCLDDALQEENRCDAYIIGLGFNDCRVYPYHAGVPGDITGSDTYSDGKPYGSYYFNMEKIIRKLHENNPDAPIFVLTNPEYPDSTGRAAQFNQVLADICAAGSQYNAHLIDLKGIYGPVFENLEAHRGPNNHFDGQTYAYMGQIIGTAITRDIQRNSGAYPRLRGYIPHETAPGGLTTEQITALDSLFRIAAYTQNAQAEYAAFRKAFGLEEEALPEEPDVPDDLGEPVYRLAQAVDFNGAEGAYDTGHALFAGADHDYSIVFEVSATTATDVIWSCDAGNNLYLKFVKNGGWFNSVHYCYGSKTKTSNGEIKNLKMVITRAAASSPIVYSLAEGSVVSDTAQSGISLNPEYSDATIQFGGTDAVGTMHDFKVYHRVLTEAEIRTYLEVTE